MEEEVSVVAAGLAAGVLAGDNSPSRRFSLPHPPN